MHSMKEGRVNRERLLLPYQLYQVEVHQTAVKRTLGLDASKLALLLFCAKKVVEAVVFVKGKVTLLIVGIDKQEAAACLVERVNKPSFDETKDIAAKVLTLEGCADAKTAYHHGRIAAVKLLTRDVALNIFLARAGNLLDAVIGKGKSGNNGSWVVVERKTIVLAKQFVTLQECITEEEFVQVVVATMEGLAMGGFFLREEPETTFVL